MIRKLALFGGAVALLGSSLFAGGAATAAGSPVNTQTASITCDSTVATTGSLKPSLTNTSPAANTPVALTLKGTVSGCTVTGASVAIASGSLSAKLTATNPGAGCAALAAPSTLTGNIVIKWKTADKSKLDFASTTIAAATLTSGSAVVLNGGTMLPAWGPGAAFGLFTASGTLAPSSAFALNAGASISGSTSQAITDLLGQCGGAGIKTVNLGEGETNA